MIRDLGTKILNMHYTNDAGYEFSALAMKPNAHHTVASPSVTTANVNLCAATKLSSSRFRFNTTFAIWVIAFDVCHHAPNSSCDLQRVIDHVF